MVREEERVSPTAASALPQPPVEKLKSLQALDSQEAPHAPLLGWAGPVFLSCIPARFSCFYFYRCKDLLDFWGTFRH